MINQHELQMGIADEMEHTKDPRLAEKIACDHIRSDDKYYTKLHAAGLEEETNSLDGLVSALKAKLTAGRRGYDHIHFSIYGNKGLNPQMGTIGGWTPEEKGKVVLLGRASDGRHYVLWGPVSPQEYKKELSGASLEEGAMTNAERGMDECGPEVAVISIGSAIGKTSQGSVDGTHKPLTSSNLGSGTPKPLTSDKLEAPNGDNKGGKIEDTATNLPPGQPVSPSKNATSFARKTPGIGGINNCNSDAMDYFGGKISKALTAEIPRTMEMIPANIYEGGASLKKK